MSAEADDAPTAAIYVLVYDEHHLVALVPADAPPAVTMPGESTEPMCDLALVRSAVAAGNVRVDAMYGCVNPDDALIHLSEELFDAYGVSGAGYDLAGLPKIKAELVGSGYCKDVPFEEGA